MNKQEREDRDLPEGIVRREGSNILYMRFMVDGQRVSKSTGTDNVKEAEKRMNAERSRIEKQQHLDSLLSPEEKDRVAKDRALKPPTTFRDFVALPDEAKGFAGGPFWTDYANNEYARDDQEKTRMYYVARIAQALKFERLAAATLRSIDDKLLKEYINRRKGQRLEAGTIIKDIAALHVVFVQARNLNFITDVPEFPDKPDVPETPGVAMSAEDQQTYFGLEGMDPELRLVATIMINTGFEPGPMVAGDWEDVHFERSKKFPHGFIHGRCQKVDTRERDRAMSPELATIMRERWLQAGRPEKGFIFPSSTFGPSRAMTYSCMHGRHVRHLERIREQEGSKRFHEYRLYDFRHTFLTRFWAATKDVMALMKAAGWKSMRQAKVYIHQTEEDLRNADEAVFAYMRAQAAVAVESDKVAAD